MKTDIFKTAILSSAFILISCESEAPEVSLNIKADKMEVSVGEPLTLSINHDAMFLSVYTGDQGHDYLKSADYLLKDKTDAELLNNNFRPTDPDIYPFVCNLADSEVGATQVKDHLIEVRNANDGTNLIGSEAEIVNDASIGKNVIKISSTHPNWWYQAIRVNTNMKVGTNQTMTLTMKFDKPYLSDIGTGARDNNSTTFPVVIRLGGVPMNETGVVFSDQTVWDIYWKPNDSYYDYTIDLSRIIKAWEDGTGKKMAKLAYAQFLFTANGNTGYVGDFYVQRISYSDYDYQAFDTGVPVNTDNGSGISTYTYIYNKPGTYQIVVIGSSVSNKNYSNDGYKKGYSDKVSAGEYKYGKIIKTIEVKVN